LIQIQANTPIFRDLFHSPVSFAYTNPDKKEPPMTEMLPEVIMDDATIDEAVQFINERVVKIVYKGSLEIGQYVLERFFDNNIQLAGSKIANKPVSFRKLCARPDLKVSRSTLMNRRDKGRDKGRCLQNIQTLKSI